MQRVCKQGWDTMKKLYLEDIDPAVKEVLAKKLAKGKAEESGESKDSGKFIKFVWVHFGIGTWLVSLLASCK